MGPYGATLKGGEDYTIESNHIEGAEVGIKLESRLSLYDNIKINSNNPKNCGLWLIMCYITYVRTNQPNLLEFP